LKSKVKGEGRDLDHVEDKSWLEVEWVLGIYFTTLQTYPFIGSTGWMPVLPIFGGVDQRI
jgi:hypothetical protein